MSDRDYEAEMHRLVCEFYGVTQKITTLFSDFRRETADHKKKLMETYDKIQERKGE